MQDVEIIGVLKSYVKKMFSEATISTVGVTQEITSGNELAEIDVSGTATNIYMPEVLVNGVTQTISSNELDLDIATNLITEDQWTSLESLYS